MVGGHRLVTVLTGARLPSMSFLDAGLGAGSKDLDGRPAPAMTVPAMTVPAMTVKERWPAIMIPVGLTLHRR
jgi:hypothetical protein